MIDAKVGEFYRVPCLQVRSLRLKMTPYGNVWVPVIGPKHSDPDIGATWQHYHIDWRFVSDRMFENCSLSVTGTPHGSVISHDNYRLHDGIKGTPSLKRRKCKRVMPSFPARPCGVFASMEASQRQRCDRLKDGHTCPHRGIDLRPFVQADGTAICPGHGMRWDLRTGELLARHAKPTSTKESQP